MENFWLCKCYWFYFSDVRDGYRKWWNDFRRSDEDKPDGIIKELGGLPPNKIHCSVLGDKALRAAIKDYYRNSNQSEKIKTEKESRIVCECLNVSEDEIKMEVLEGVKDFDTLQKEQKFLLLVENVNRK